MKTAIIVLSVALVFHSTLVFGQSIALAQYDLPKADNKISLTPKQRRHCVTRRVGECMFIAGTASTIFGVVDYNRQKNIDYNTSVFLGDVIVSSTVFAFGGIFIYFIGKEYERNNRERFTIISKPNQFGMAYNF